MSSPFHRDGGEVYHHFVRLGYYPCVTGPRPNAGGLGPTLRRPPERCGQALQSGRGIVRGEADLE
jgi:hypothetical protein